MKKLITLGLLVTLFVSPGTTALAQRPGFGRGPGRLDNLALGMDAPEVVVCDENGEEFSLKSLRGKHVVLVFGCLT